MKGSYKFRFLCEHSRILYKYYFKIKPISFNCFEINSNFDHYFKSNQTKCVRRNVYTSSHAQPSRRERVSGCTNALGTATERPVKSHELQLREGRATTGGVHQRGLLTQAQRSSIILASEYTCENSFNTYNIS